MPDLKIDWVVEESFADIPRLHSGVDAVLTVAMRRWRKQVFSSKAWHEMTQLKQQIQDRTYDLVLDTQGLLKSAVISYLANAPRHGYDRQSIREPLAACFYDNKHKVSKDMHAVARIRQLAAQTFGYEIPESLPDYGIETISSESDYELPVHYVVGLHGTSRDSKLWPQDHWIALGKYLSSKGLALVLPWGSEAEYQRATEIAIQTPQTIVLPKMQLKALASVIASARTAIGVDTGLMHLAVALKKPSVAIYTDTDPRLTGIYPGEATLGINLGGKSQIPSAAYVIDCLTKQHII